MADIEASSDSEAIGAALRLVIGRIARRLRQTHAVGELTLAEVSVLSRLEGDGASTPSALAEQERIRPQAMATTLAALEERGLILRRPDAEDGRRAVLTVTEAGRTTVFNRRSESAQRLATVLDSEFDAAERAELSAVLALLERLAEHL
ncbi:MAG TPA: MarR family transcriptional regulator [Pseudonocardiaceae bacterium]|nr:MarR family transcriptional regulator [Pseudonocardiaceae bacterium]